jgi:hypothetical protein
MPRTCGGKTHVDLAEFAKIMDGTLLTVVVGDVGEYLSTAAKKINSSAYLVDLTNAQQSHQGVIYTSLGDIDSIELFFKLLKSADKIVYCPPLIWSDGKTNQQRYSAAWLTEYYMQTIALATGSKVDNFSGSSTNSKYDIVTRKSIGPQMWVTGCSTTFGSGVSDQERYWGIIKNQLKLEATILAAPGASNPWCRDQLLKCDIKSGDIVIWGLTTMTRFPWVIDNTIKHVNQSFYTSNPEFNSIVNVGTLECDQRIYESISSIQQIVHFCKKVGAYLIIASIHGNLEIIAEAARYKELLIIHGANGLNWDSSFLDFGHDNLHPGPKTHNMYAEKILERISKFDILDNNSLLERFSK